MANYTVHETTRGPKESAPAGFDITFLPADPPRRGRVAYYRLDGGPLPDEFGEAGTVTVVVDAVGRKREVAAVLCEAGRASERLATADGGTASGRVWALAARKALELVACGLIAPGLDAEGAGAWRIAGIDGVDAEWLHRLAAAMPIEACCAVDEEGRLPDPYRLLRAFCDAVADDWARGPAVTALTGAHALVAAEPVDCPEFTPAAVRLALERDAGWSLALAVEPGEESVGLRAMVCDRADPYRLFDAEDVGVGEDVLRSALESAALASGWPVLLDLARGHGEPVCALRAEDVAYLLDGGAEHLGECGIELRWDASIERGLRASLSIDGPTGPGGGLFSLGELLSFRWRAVLGDQELSEAELDRIARSHSPVVRVGERWVLVDETVRERLRRRLDRPAPLEALRAALTGSVEVGGRAVPVSVSGPLAEVRDRLRAPEGAEAVAQPAALMGRLREYQLRGLQWMVSLTELGLGACLADDMGLGKTITLIAHHLHRQSDGATAGPTLVVCPASLMANWDAEIGRFAPDAAVRRFHGPGRGLEGLEKNEFVVTTYATMRRDAERLAGVEWSMVCADEAQHIKNPASASSKALRSIGSGVRVALTGTPVENNLTDLWSILDWATPGLLGSLEGFRSSYGAAEHGDAETAAGLGKLVRPFMLRRLKTDPGIAPELPEKTLTDQRVTLSRTQVALYKRVVDETMAAIASAEGIERRGLVLALLTRLKQVCNHPAQYSGSDDPAAGRSGKLDLLDELLGTVLVEDERALVFTQYARMGRLLASHLERRGIGVDFLHGGTPVKRREAMVADFQAGATPVLILSLKAAGVGLNLTRATHVIHYDRWWNPAVEDQATDRAFRIGQTKAVQVHRLVCEGTIEERIAVLLERKRGLAEAVVGSGEAALTELTDEQLHELVRLEER